MAGTSAKRSRASSRNVKGILLQVGTIAGLILAWELVGRLMTALSTFFPPVEEIAVSMWSLLSAGALNTDLATTGYEVLWGILVGGGAGILVGIALGSSDFLSGVFESHLTYFAALPKIILYPIFILFLGTGVESKIGIGTISAFFPIAINTMAGVHEVNPVFVKAARTLGARTRHLYLHVYLPYALGPIVAGLRIGVGVAIVGTLLAETKQANSGLGLRVIELSGELRLAEMYGVIIFLFVIVIVINWLMGLLYARVTRYRGEGSRQVTM